MSLTSADVARRAGVSRSTVSYILNGHGARFSESTRQAVEQAVADLGYRPQAAARTLVRGTSDLVLLVLPEAVNGQNFQVATILTEALAERGLYLLMRPATQSLTSFTAVVGTVQPLAVIALAALSAQELAVLRDAQVRTLDLARASSQPGGANWAIGHAQVLHLHERGFERIAYASLAEARGDALLQARARGARDACHTLGLPQPQELILSLRTEADYDVIATMEPGTGVACYNDDVAAAALGAAHAVGRDVPRDLGLIGVDNSPVATQTSPRLSTIDLDTHDIVQRLVTAILDESSGEEQLFGGQLRIVQGGTS